MACFFFLVVIYFVVQSLCKGELDMVLVVGVNLIFEFIMFMIFVCVGMLFFDGCCKIFDGGVNGYVCGEGCGIVVLKCFFDVM